MKLVSTNPSKNYEVIGEVEVSTEQDVKNAVDKARKALPKWSGLPLSKRSEIITSFIKISEKNSEKIARIITQETGRTIKSSRGNVAEGIEYFKAYIKMAPQYLSPKITLDINAVC